MNRSELDHKGQRRGGLYFHPETQKPYISVTTALSIIEKPALTRWHKDQMFNVVVANPSISRDQAHVAAMAKSEAAKSRGSTVHSIVEAIKTGTELEVVTPQFQGYLDGFKQWMADFGVELHDQERTVYSQRGYAGTLDLLASTRGARHPIVIDVKTGKSIYQEAFLQTAAYRSAVEEQGMATSGTGVVLLREDGSYAYEFKPQTERHFQGFLAAKTLYEATHEDDLQKIGYFEAWEGAL